MPTLLLFIVDGRRGVREAWPVAAVTGVVFAILQWWASNYFAYELTDVIASLGSFAAAVVMLRWWRPTTPDEQRSHVVDAGRDLTPQRVILGLLPYWLVVIIFGVGKLWRLGFDVPAALAATDVKIQWPGLYGNLLGADGAPSQLGGLHVPVAVQPGHDAAHHGPHRHDRLRQRPGPRPGADHRRPGHRRVLPHHPGHALRHPDHRHRPGAWRT